ncbi:Uncharacterised protein [Mycobacteroides abscessus subsp. abscessus]|nr:Uncharacterised protein [Mycobacteroides abscessus subsp. abscessus]
MPSASASNCARVTGVVASPSPIMLPFARNGPASE